jgi:hypothetical protein
MKNDPGREVALFTQAVKVPIHERAAFLERACSGDDSLRRKLEALLRASDRSGNFLEEPAIPAALASWLRERAVPANRKRPKKSKASFQSPRKKRKGR